MNATKPDPKRCSCGRLIVLAAGDDECAVCQMKRMEVWVDPIEELKKKYRKDNGNTTTRAA